MGFVSKISDGSAGAETSSSEHASIRLNGRPGTQPSGPCPPPSLVDVLVHTLWAVAWGENLRGQEAIATLLLNRAHYVAEQRPRMMTRSLALVCWALQRQVRGEREDISARAGGALADGAMSYVRERSPQTPSQGNVIQEAPHEMCRRVARRLIAGRLTDLTGGARHYHDAGVHPLWAWDHVPSAIIGDLVFYNF